MGYTYADNFLTFDLSKASEVQNNDIISLSITRL